MNTYDFVNDMMDEAVASGVFPAGVAAVGCKDALLHVHAAGSCNLDTRFDMASMTKILVPTMLALRGLQDGDLTLDDTVSQFSTRQRTKHR